MFSVASYYNTISSAEGYDGTVRLFPAITPNDNVAFKLATRGGFLVSAIYQKGEFYCIVESTLGNTLNIAFENSSHKVKFLSCDTGAVLLPTKEDNICSLQTQKGEKIVVCSENGEKLKIEKDYKKNCDFKTLGDANLGCEREL